MVALLAGVLAGTFNGVLVGVVRIQPIVATLGIAGSGLALMIADGRLTEIFDPAIRVRHQAAHWRPPAGSAHRLRIDGDHRDPRRFTVFGKRLVAIGGSPDAAQTAGLPFAER